MKKGILVLVVLVILSIVGFLIYTAVFQINENDARKAVSNYLYEDKIKDCNSDSNDNYLYGDDCTDYYRCYSDEFGQYAKDTHINEIKNNLMEGRISSSSGLTFNDVKIIPEIENNDQYNIYEIKNKCFIQVYEGKGLILPANARSYFETISNDALIQGSFCSNTFKISDEQACGEALDCLITAVSSRMSSSEATALTNFIKLDEERYNLAGFEIFREIKVLEDADLRDFTEQCGQI